MKKGSTEVFVEMEVRSFDRALNINIPAISEKEIRGVVVAKQGRARLIESFEKRVDPRENIYGRV